MFKNYFSIVLLLACFSTFAFGAAGDLDPTFGSGGKVFATVAGMEPARGMTLQPDGKVIIVGTVLGQDSTSDFAVVRLNSDGSTDLGFGTNGLVSIPFDNFANEQATAAAVQSDGKIVIGGSVEFGSQGWDFGIVRLESNGALDTAFGKVKVNIGGDDFANDLILQADGKILLTGTIRPTPNTDVPLVRLTTTGALDTSLNGTGKVFVGIGSGNNDVGNSLAVQPDGKILIAGSTRTASRGYFLLLRFTTNGLPDSTLGSFGFIQTEIGAQFDAATSVAIQSDGKIVAGGNSTSGGPEQPAFVRYNTNGSLDTSFDSDGKVLLNPTPSNTVQIKSLMVLSDGKLIGVGTASASYLLLRMTTNGALDPTFGTGGRVLQSVAPSTSDVARAMLQPDGKVVAAGGGSSTTTFGFTAARFVTVSFPRAGPFDLDGDQKTDVAIFRPNGASSEWWWLRSSNGGNAAVVFGANTDTIVPADYTGDGKTDVAFWRPSNGNWFVLRSEDLTFFAAPFGANGDTPVPGDYDADGKADFAVFRPATLNWFINKSSGGTDIFTFGAAGDKPVPGDFDGDGKSDIAIYRPNGGSGSEWWIRRSSTGAVFATQFGSPTDKTVPGDYTGDGKTDIAFWRPSNGNWFILRSEDFSFFAFPFGANGDTAVPGDYDGDGRWDAGVFRPSNSTWFVQRSTAGTLIQQFGITNDVPLPSAYVR
ncbi:MAG TPA: FG-GAP-like repeat-containing protein [Pyrinomonadaceae bacterium]|nr:FG-GAP-like repeat-containing protein [Pyrinomonadaceae bacterium]